MREVASSLANAARPSDVIIVVPEWYAASFDHYCTKPVEEIEYPNPGRGGMVDFSHVFERVSDDRPVALLGERIRRARAEGRRIWLITARNYLRRVSLLELAHAKKYRESPIMSIHRAGQIRDSLRASFGEPDTSLFLRDGPLLYGEVLPFLYGAGQPASAGLSLKH